MSKSITLESLLKNGSITPEGVVRAICDDPKLSAVVGNSIAYQANTARHEDDPYWGKEYTESSEWMVKAAEYLLVWSLRDYVRTVEEDGILDWGKATNAGK
jgi:hypothetical protein